MVTTQFAWEQGLNQRGRRIIMADLGIRGCSYAGGSGKFPRFDLGAIHFVPQGSKLLIPYLVLCACTERPGYVAEILLDNYYRSIEKRAY
jgi:hypothetical protein